MSRTTPRQLTARQIKLLERLRAASRAGAARRRYDGLLDELAFAARDRVLYFPWAKQVEFEGIKFPIGTGAISVAVLDPLSSEPLISAIRSATGEQR